MSTQRAIIHKSQGVLEIRDDVPLPGEPADDWILVKTKAVALNPADWQEVDEVPSPDSIAGVDFAGVVEAAGDNVTAYKLGDRVAGLVRGGDPTDHANGAFAQHIKARVGINFKIPDNLSFEQAATLGAGITTVGQGLYQELGLPLPPAKVNQPTSILIYGGSTATGTLAIQFAKLSGYRVITTSSLHNAEYLMKLGADEVFDYKDPECGSKIREVTSDNLKLVYDCVAEHGSFDICAAAMSSTGGRLTALLPVDGFPRNDIKATFRLGYTALGESYNEEFPASPEDFEFGSRFWKIAEQLLASGQIVPHRVEVRSGFDTILQGLQELKSRKVSGAKIVCLID